MPSEELPFLGQMNLDDPYAVLPKGSHVNASNIIFRGTGSNLQAQNLLGTREITSLTLPTGVNVCIGRKYDAVKNRVFYFNYNSLGTHGIYILNGDETVNTLIQTGTNTLGDPLGFDANVSIDSIDILYGDLVDGDILYYVDSLLRPTKINIDRYLAGTYNPILRNYIDVAKAPPQMPVKCVYENESGSTIVTNTALNALKTNNTPLFLGGLTDYAAFTSFSATLFTSNSNKTEFTYTGTPTTLFTFNIALAISFNQTGITTGVVLKNGSPISGTSMSYYAGFSNTSNFNQSVYVSLSTGDKISIRFTTTVAVSYPSNFFVVGNGSFVGTYQSASSSPVLTVNNVRNSLFQFKYRYVYDDNEKSVWSSNSIVPLPNQSYSALTNNDYSLNSRISLFFTTGDVNVKKIEIAGRQVKDGATSDYFLIDSLDKSLLSINSNDVYWYKFYNNGTYSFIDIKESILLQSLVPQKTGCQALLNGNVLGYGNITEGYNEVPSSLGVNLISGTPYFFDYNGLLFFATINGIDSGSNGTILKLYLYGTGTNTSGNVTTLDNAASNFVINAVNGSGTSIGTTYNNATDSVTVASILTAISASLVTNGFTQVSLAGNILTMSYPTAITLFSSGTSTTGSFYESPHNSLGTVFAYPQKSNYSAGLMYFDSSGRTNGATVPLGFSFATGTDDTNVIGHPQLQINHRPPLWATSYSVVRSRNLTYNKRLTWVTNGAYSDSNPNILGVKYAYLEIDNISQYNTLIEATQGVVGYTFSKGDRVRIYNRYDATGTVATLPAVYDYEIIGTTSSVIINGIEKTGNFIQIYYPTADISVNFKFNGDPDFLAYQVIIYNYISHSDTNNEVYFEFGKMFGIGNAGTANAFHIGQEQTQSSTLTTPALIGIGNGDFFSRQRPVPIGQTYTFSATGFNNGFIYIAPQLSITGSSVTNALYTVQSSDQVQSNSLTPADYTASKAFFLNLSSTKSVSVRVRASIPVTVDGSTSTGVLLQTANSDGTFGLVTAVTPIAMVANTAYNIVVDSIVIVQPLGRLHFIVQNTSQVINQHVVGFTVTVDVINNVTIPIVENSFSDVYSLVTNSNGRPTLVDINAKQTTYSTLFRYSQPYQLGTNINGTNIFYDLNSDEFTKDYGTIIRLKVHEREMRVYQQIRVGVVGIYSKFIKDQTGTNSLVTSDTIITKNNINYYVGDSGLTIPSALVTEGNVDYFPSVNKGEIIRLSQDGMTPISSLYKVKTWSGVNVQKFSTDSPYTYGGKAKIVGTFNYIKDRHGEVIFCLQGSTDKTPYTISFDEDRNSFSSFYTFYPDHILCAGNKLITWRNGRLYVHDNASAYNTFYGTSYPSKIELVSNQGGQFKKDFTYITYISPLSQTWTAANIGDVVTSIGQQSNLVYADFDWREGRWDAAFMRDNNGTNGIIDGDYLKGEWIFVRLQLTSSALATLNSASISFIQSPKN
jgi:hypothetical protein